MATDNERRRVAAALRKTRVFTLEGRQEDGSVVGWQVALMSDLSKTVGIDDSIGFDTFARLADLVDPDLPPNLHLNLRTREEPTSVVPKFDREALLALASDMDLYARTVPYPSCGRSVAAYADRIREACGETANGLPTSRAGSAPAGIDFELLATGDGRPHGADAPEKN